MRFATLLSVAALSAIVLTGCERQITSPIINTVEHQEIDTQFAQSMLLDLAKTATSQGFMNLADAVTEFVEALTTEDQTSVQPTFSKLSRLASEVTFLINSFDNAGCSIELRTFAESSVDAIKAYTVRDAADMERALQHLAQEAGTANMTLQRSDLIASNNSFRPFVFGDSSRYWPDGYSIGHQALGDMALGYKDLALRKKTNTAVFNFLATKGYKAIVPQGLSGRDCEDVIINLGAKVDTRLIIEEFEEELKNIPNLAYVSPVGICSPPMPQESPPPTLTVPPLTVNDLIRLVINSISDRYNRAWCQGNLDVNTVDSILIEESGLDFFYYAFLQNLADIYAEEKPETAERIRSNMFSFRWIVMSFLGNYLFSVKTEDELIKMYPQYGLQRDYKQPLPDEPSDSKLEKTEKTLDEIIELFRHSVRSGHVHIDADKAPDSYYYYWKWR